MTEKRESCICSHCGNEAEMIIKCELIEPADSSAQAAPREKHTRTCTVCGNEADLIIELEG